MVDRVRLATAMALRDQQRRPLVLILLLVVPVYVVTRSIAMTEATPRRIELPGGAQALTDMQQLHGANMAGIAIAFTTALVGVFVMQSALQGDRRLVIAGYRPGEALLPRLLVLGVATVLVIAVSSIATAVFFTPESWPRMLMALVLIGAIYGGIGALAGAVLSNLAATYLILFLVMTDLGVVQNPMFGDGTPASWAVALPGYGPVRVMIDASYSSGFHSSGPLLLAVLWTSVLVAAVFATLRRAVAART